MIFAEKYAAELAEEHKTADPFELCDELEIIIVVCPLPTGVKGFYSSAGGRRMIYIGSDVDESERVFICAHELGHALLHTDMNAYFISEETAMLPGKYEREADLFAAALLIERAGGKPDVQCDIRALAADSGVPERVLREMYKM